MEPGSPAEQASSTAYWQVPADVPIVLVDDTDKLQQWRGMIESAVAVGIDAEWKPNSKEPKATVLQLACLASNGQERVFVLDMLALDMEDVGALLQSLFRSKHCLKVGFGLLQDVKAVAAALGAIGGGCTAVLDPQLDLAVVHRLLVRRRWRGVHASSGPGLSGFVAAQLGLSLDKRQQCSPWDLRPLTDAQIAYAATDASCLLALLRSLALAAAPSDTRFFGDERIRSRGGRLGEGQDASAGAAPAAVPGEEGPGPSGGTGWLQDASQHWGCRMEFVGKSVWRERLAPCWRQLEALGSRSGDLSAIGFPEDVPWLLGVERPRFVADTMAEGLARQLRLCGVDCVSTQPVGKNQRHLVYRQLKDLSEGEGRVILTSDRAFVRSRYSDHTYFVQSQTKQQQLTEVLQAFDIKIEGDDLLSRCVQCNGEITQTPLTWNQLPQTAQSTVPLSIRCNHSLYWLCNRCSKVYWQGSQYGKAVQSMSERLAAVTMC